MSNWSLLRKWSLNADDKYSMAVNRALKQKKEKKISVKFLIHNWPHCSSTWLNKLEYSYHYGSTSEKNRPIGLNNKLRIWNNYTVWLKGSWFAYQHLSQFGFIIESTILANGKDKLHQKINCNKTNYISIQFDVKSADS